MNNLSVARAWVCGQPARTKHLRTDGEYLWSYNLCIAKRDPYGMLVYDYTASGQFVSMTTSKHVGIALRTAGKANLIQP
mgnify:CR=1 FL=1|jgi:hypothetical protein